MTYDEVIRILGASGRAEWTRPSGPYMESYVYKNALNLRIEEADELRDKFSEPWADTLSMHPPERRVFVVYYRSSPVLDVHMVWIDQRAMLPLPKSRDDLTITRWDYNFSQLVTDHPGEDIYGPDRYLEQAGIRVE